MAPGRGWWFRVACIAAVIVCAAAGPTPQQQNQQQQLLKQQQALHCETIRLQNQATALHSLPTCGGFADFNFANFTSTKAEFGNFCAWYCSVHQGVVKWQEKVFFGTRFGKRCPAPVDPNLDMIAAYWCTTATDGSFCFKTLFSDSVKGVPTCTALRNLDTQCKYQLKEVLDVFATAPLRQTFQRSFNQCRIAYPASAPAPPPLAGAKVPAAPVFRPPAVNYISGGRICPDGSAPLSCTEQDCGRSSCARYPGSQCVADHCNKCLPTYNAQVGVTGDLFGWNANCSCPDGSLPNICSPSPCSVAKCPAFPEAYCLVDTCYGCNAIYMVNGTEVDCGVQTKFPAANATATLVTQMLPSSVSLVGLQGVGKVVTPQTSYAPPAKPAVVNPFAVGQTCPNGQPPPVTPPASICNSSACAQPLCARYPTAQCVVDECDGCTPKYNLNVGLSGNNLGYDVTASCPCPDGSQPFTKSTGHPCIPDPCTFLKCNNFPDAFCISDLCNGCNAVFLVNGAEVDCGTQVRFPGNVTGTSTITSASLVPTATTPTSSSTNQSQTQIIAQTAKLITAVQQGNLTAILPLVTNTSILYAPNLPGPLGFRNASALGPFLSAAEGNVSSPVFKSYFAIDPTSALITEEFAANAFGNVYATLLWVYTNGTSNGTSPSSSWQLQYAALTPAPNGTIS